MASAVVDQRPLSAPIHARPPDDPQPWATARPPSSSPSRFSSVSPNSRTPASNRAPHIALLVLTRPHPARRAALRGARRLLERRLPDPVRQPQRGDHPRRVRVLHDVLQGPARYQGELFSLRFSCRSVLTRGTERRNATRLSFFWNAMARAVCRRCCTLSSRRGS